MIINLLEYLENSAKKFPKKIALSDIENSIIYEELLSCSKSIGTSIAKKINVSRKPIVVFIDRSLDSLILFFSILYSGNFYVPIDPSLPKERIKSILEIVNPILCVSVNENTNIPCKYSIIHDLKNKKIDESLLINIRENSIDIDPVYSIFTSGSTGFPKGVVVSHKSIIDLIEQFCETFNFDDTMVFGNQAPFDFDVSVKDIYNCLKVGGSLEIIPKNLFIFPKKVIEFLNSRKINTIIWSVSAMRIISDFNTFEKYKPLYLRYAMFSGEVMPIRVINNWLNYLPTIKYINLYGPTEITCNCTYYEIKEQVIEFDSVPIGKAFKNSRVFIVDKDNKIIKKIGIKGEICVEGSCLSLGYYNDFTKTDEAFKQNPTINSFKQLIYQTGDIAYYNKNGDLVFSSRKDNQIKHMGHRIELEEIEFKLNQIDFIEISCCIYDDVLEKIVMFYQSEIEDDKKIVFELGNQLPKYMFPNRFIKLQKMPLNKNGKIDRKYLRKEFFSYE